MLLFIYSPSILSFHWKTVDWNYMPAQTLQSCPVLCNPMDCTPPGSSIHGILQAGILEWIAMPSSRGPSKTQRLNPHRLCLLHWQAVYLSLVPSGSPLLKVPCAISWRLNNGLPGVATSLQFPESYLLDIVLILGSAYDTVVKNKSANAGDLGDVGSIPGSGRFPGVWAGNTPVLLPGKFHGQRSQQATVHGILRSQTGLSTHTMLNCVAQKFSFLVNNCTLISMV